MLIPPPPHSLQVPCVCLLVLVVRNDFYSEDEWSPCLVCKIVSKLAVFAGMEVTFELLY